MINSSKLGWAIFFLLNIVIGVLLIRPGHLSVDEGIYHFMSFGFQQGDGNEIWNGWTEFQTTELRILKTFLMIEGNGRLVSQYPQFSSWISSPLYSLFGYLGLFYTNLLCFPILVFCTYRLGNQFGSTENGGLVAAILLGLGTFIWSYALAAWPHMLSTTIGIGAFTLFFQALQKPPRWKQTMLLSGFLVSLGCGIRLDNAFVVAAMFTIVAIRSPKDWNIGVLLLLGMLPCFALMGWINLDKWSSFNPFSYGPRDNPTRTSFDPKILFIAGSLILLRLLSAIPSVEQSIKKRWKPILGSGTIFAIAVSFFPVGEKLTTIAHGAATLVFDLRLLPDTSELAMRRTPAEAVMYLSSFKKSLIQSIPFLPLILLTPILFKEKTRQWVYLAVLPAGLLVYLSRTFWHGGLCLNQRYFLSTLPLISIMAVPTVELLIGKMNRTTAKFLLLGTIPVGLIFLYGSTSTKNGSQMAEMIFLWFPLLLSGLCFSMVAIVTLTTARMKPATLIVFGATVFWGSLTGIGYDYARERATRIKNWNIGTELNNNIKDDSILFIRRVDPAFQLIDRHQIRLALPFQDQFADFPNLAKMHLNNSRPVYMLLSKRDWKKRSAAVSSHFSIEPVIEIGRLHLKELKTKNPPNPSK